MSKFDNKVVILNPEGVKNLTRFFAIAKNDIWHFDLWYLKLYKEHPRPSMFIGGFKN